MERASQDRIPRLLALSPPIAGYERFFAAYLFRGDRTAIVDVGPAAALPSLLAALAETGIGPEEVDYVLLTHVHMDHSGGTGAAIRRMPNAAVVAHPRARPHLIDPARLWEASLRTLGDLAIEYGPIDPVPADRIVDAEDLMRIDLGEGVELEVLFTPGHAPHHLSLFYRAGGVLVVGEAAGVCVDGALRPSTPPPFRLEEALISLDRLVALGPRAVCYAHRGCYDDGVAVLRWARQQLTDWHGAVHAATGDGRSPEEILEALMKEDRDLDYLARLTPDEYRREHRMLVNSVIGLSGARQT